MGKSFGLAYSDGIVVTDQLLAWRAGKHLRRSVDIEYKMIQEGFSSPFGPIYQALV